MKPTQEQIKEFWEWCGLIHINNPIPIEAANSCEAIAIDKPLNGWYCPDYAKGTSKLISFKETPIIDLNNLFKWAVPKLEEIGLDIELKRTIEPKWRVIISNYTDRPPTMGDDDNPALALFWAIWKVVKEEQNGS